MVRSPRSSIMTYGSIVLLLVGLLLLWPGMLNNLFTTTGFEPRGYYFKDTPNLLMLFTISDLLIGIAYVSISFSLAYLVYRARRDIPFHWMFMAFGTFIVACGVTHFMDVITLWNPLYWLSGYSRLVTAVLSIITAIILPPLIPKSLEMIRSAKEATKHKAGLIQANDELEQLYKRHVEVSQLKGELFASVSFELRTPLALLLGPIESLQSASNLTDDQRSLLKVLDRNARALQQHLDDLLDLSRIQTGKSVLRFAEVDLVALMHLTASYFEVMTRLGQIDFVLETPPSLIAQVDQDKFKQIVLNLLANAFRFVPDGGKVKCVLSQEDGNAVICIQDNGPDARPTNRTSNRSMFERIVQQHEQDTVRIESGSSLGLAIATEYIELHGGTITLEDTQEGGAAYIVTLPLAAPINVPVNVPVKEKLEPPIQATNESLPPLLEGLRQRPDRKVALDDDERPLVLVVEDNADMNQFIAQTLSMKYRVVRAYNGQEGLNCALSYHPDLIVSDLMMPIMSGEDLLRAVRTRPSLSRVPVVLLTAKLDNATQVRLLREGAQDYIIKPFSVDELLVRVENLISQKRAHEVLEQEIVHQEEDVAVLITELDRRKRELDSTLRDLQLSESRFRRLSDANIIGIMLVNLNGMIMEANDAFLNMIGYTRAELASGQLRWTTLTPPDDSDRDRQVVDEIRRTGVAAPWEKEYIHKSGRHVPVLVGVALLEGSHDECVCFVVDLTERKRHEDMQRFLAEASSVLASSLNYEDVLEKLVNVSVPAFADWCALYARDESGNFHMSKMACHDLQLYKLLETISASHNVEQVTDVANVLDGGKPAWIASIDPDHFEQYPGGAAVADFLRQIGLRSRIIVPLQTRGETVGVLTFNTAGALAHEYTKDDVAVAEDLARRAALAVDNARLYTESQQAIRTRDEFLSIAAHELRTPVTSLRGFAQLTLRYFQREAAPDLGRIHHSLASIEGQSIRLTRLVNQLLSIARIQSGRLELECTSINLADVARSVAASAQSLTTNHIVSVNAPEQLTINADPLRLEQVLTNLVDNAIKYSPGGGPVTIDLTRQADVARIAITDKGVGIPPEHRDNIFNRYYQAHEKSYLGGMGLGLYISREIIELHGGHITAEFPEDGGTRFVIELPLESRIKRSANGQSVH